MFWGARAVSEFQRAPVTWLVTLTLSAESNAYFLARMHAPLIVRGKTVREARPLAEASEDQRFRWHAQEVGFEITSYLKRLREAKGPLRYLCVTEAHKSGYPHFHLLIHERCPGVLVSADEYKPLKDGKIGVHDFAFVRTQWESLWGFARYEKCRDENSAYYVCKYVSKEMAGRVRASQKYGEGPTFPKQPSSESLK